MSVILIRHAEKALPGSGIQGVDEAGRPDEHSLSVRGWQRAGALVRWLAPLPGTPGIGVPLPTSLWAAPASARHPSRRPLQTLQPLAQLLRQPVRLREDAQIGLTALAAEITGAGGVALACWRHEALPALGAAIAPALAARLPTEWADDCYDEAWLFERTGGGGWRFSRWPQRLLDGDRDLFDPH